MRKEGVEGRGKVRGVGKCEGRGGELTCCASIPSDSIQMMGIT